MKQDQYLGVASVLAIHPWQAQSSAGASLADTAAAAARQRHAAAAACWWGTSDCQQQAVRRCTWNKQSPQPGCCSASSDQEVQSDGRRANSQQPDRDPDLRDKVQKTAGLAGRKHLTLHQLDRNLTRETTIIIKYQISLLRTAQSDRNRSRERLQLRPLTLIRRRVLLLIGTGPGAPQFSQSFEHAAAERR